MNKFQAYSLIALLFSICLTSCQTIREPYQGRLPIKLKKQFVDCSLSDGEVRIAISKLQKPIISFPLEWVSDSNSNWAAEYTSSFGNTIFEIAYDSAEGRLKMSGLNTDSLDISLDENGYILIDGYTMPIRAKELPCFLANGWPKEWLQHLQSVKRNGDFLEMKMHWDEREGHLQFQAKYPDNSCLTMVTSYFWGLVNRKVRVCRYVSQMVFEIQNGYQLRIFYAEER